MTTEQKTKFKKGDKIDLQTGFACDRGTVIRQKGTVVIWESNLGGTYKSPLDIYDIIKIS